MNIARNTRKGFTILEMLLVLVIMGSILGLISSYTTQKMAQLRRDKAAIQMQQILSGGLAYYLNNGRWPVAALTNVATAMPGYIATGLTSPYVGQNYFVYSTGTNNQFFAVQLTTTGVQAASDARILAGMLPGGSFAGNTVTAQVIIPGQNLNNARSFNFGGLYKSGACVPSPACPTGMNPDIIVVPASVSGVNDAATATTTYNIQSFTAYAYGAPAASAAVDPGSSPVAGSSPGPASCVAPTSGVACGAGTNGAIIAGALYWRVCLQVITEAGVVSSGSWANYQTVAAFTRCVPPGEPSGSDFTVYNP